MPDRQPSSALLRALLCALVIACQACDPPPPPPTMTPLKTDPRDVNARPGAPDAPPPASAFGVLPDAGLQAQRTPLRENDPNAPVSVATCADDWLARHNLNKYGDPQGTMYPGATPLFNELTGARIDRFDYLFSRHADLRAACAPTKK